MEKKIFGSICFVLGIMIIVSTGTTFAYFSANSSNGGETITGTTKNFDVEIEFDPIYTANQLIPIDDEYINRAISKETDKCIDSKGYEVCSLYSVTLINNGDPAILNGFLKTINSEYETDNLRCQLYDSNYTPHSNVMTISKDSDNKVYFMNEENMFNLTLASEESTNYYLAIWLYETGELQDEDYSRNFSGKIGFESIDGAIISADFSA